MLNENVRLKQYVIQQYLFPLLGKKYNKYILAWYLICLDNWKKQTHTHTTLCMNHYFKIILSKLILNHTFCQISLKIVYNTLRILLIKMKSCILRELPFKLKGGGERGGALWFFLGNYFFCQQIWWNKNNSASEMSRTNILLALCALKNIIFVKKYSAALRSEKNIDNEKTIPPSPLQVKWMLPYNACIENHPNIICNCITYYSILEFIR